ncbi:S-layer homology domain-containing protein [Moorella stamsii]|uniref:S-layer homology domain-containing protein n=1 Tax=Neomoorella stamsii TaxID=1266720 RepID=UPI0006D588C6|nr:MULTISPECIES: S-layer homology domain-containing protein [Moorella]
MVGVVQNRLGGKFYWLTFWGIFLTIYLVQALPAAAADFYRYQGGIKGEKEYAEVLYLTGEPVLLQGTVQETTGPSRDGKTTSRVTFTLENKEKAIKLNRSLSFITEIEKNGRQEVNTTRLERFSETITVGQDRYALQDFQFSRSELLDHQPAVVYQSGNWTARKVYSVNNDLAKVTVETWGHTVGYRHAWGSTETSQEEGTVFFSGKVAIDKENFISTTWSSSFHQDLSYHRSRYLEYQANEPLAISFPGGYVENTRTTETLHYRGNFPDLENGLLASSRWLRKEGSYELKSLPSKKWLRVANLADIRGHWAEADIRQLYGLGALGEEGDYFRPALPFFRGQFARALVAVLDLPLPAGQSGWSPLPGTGGLPSPSRGFPGQPGQIGSPFTRPNFTGQAGQPYGQPVWSGQSPLTYGRPGQPALPQEKPLFADVATTDPAYKYYQAVYEAGVMTGTGPGLFGPTEPLTRAEALVILVRALGLKGLAPAGYVRTPFRDDWDIPAWARTAVYVANKIGLIQGDEYGFLKPNETLTRAEAAVFLNRFIHYLQEEMTADYRERVLNFN